MEEKETVVTEKNDQSGSLDNGIYIDAIKKLKETTVSKDEYERVKSDNKRLLEGYVNGQNPEKETVVKIREPKEIIKDMNKDGISNMEYVKLALEYRQSVFDKTGKDVFVGESMDPHFDSELAKVKAQNCADVYQQCLDEANGSEVMFNALLSERINDVKIPPRKR